jgi:hypothetical protein
MSILYYHSKFSPMGENGGSPVPKANSPTSQALC